MLPNFQSMINKSKISIASLKTDSWRIIMDQSTELVHTANRTPGADGAEATTEARKKQQRQVSAYVHSSSFYDSFTFSRPLCPQLPGGASDGSTASASGAPVSGEPEARLSSSSDGQFWS